MENRMQIRDLRVVLKDFERIVKEPKHLRTGRMDNFRLRPREAWANWLLCAVLASETGKDYTFAEDDEGDGVIIDRGTKEWFRTEHVSALAVPNDVAHLKNEDRIIAAIDKKVKKGEEYAKNKSLLVFVEDAELWYPNKVGKAMAGKHGFQNIYVIGLVDGTNDYLYSLAELGDTHSGIWNITVNEDFDDWSVSRVQ